MAKIKLRDYQAKDDAEKVEMAVSHTDYNIGWLASTIRRFTPGENLTDEQKQGVSNMEELLLSLKRLKRGLKQNRWSPTV